MKIIQYGEIAFREGVGPDIRGWVVEREDTDPSDATDEQLLLGFAILWAKEKFNQALNSAALQVFRDIAERKRQADLAAGEPSN